MTTVFSSGGVGSFTLVRILPIVSTVLTTVLTTVLMYPFQDPPDLLTQSFDVGNFSGGEWFFYVFYIFTFLSWFQSLHFLRKPMG